MEHKRGAYILHSSLFTINASMKFEKKNKETKE